MNKLDLVQKIRSRMQLENDRNVSATDVDALLKALGTEVQNELEDGGEVTLPGIGKFSTGERAERKGRNPQTGEEITIPAAKVAKFKPLKALKDAINQ